MSTNDLIKGSNPSIATSTPEPISKTVIIQASPEQSTEQSSSSNPTPEATSEKEPSQLSTKLDVHSNPELSEMQSEENLIEEEEPAEVDLNLESPVFKEEETSIHVTQLKKVLGFTWKKMIRSQKLAARNFLSSFISFYTDLTHYNANTQLHYPVEILNILFAKIEDDGSAWMPQILGVVTIVSRHCKTNINSLAKLKGPDGGLEPRITCILPLIKRGHRVDLQKEAVRALINYAEVNSTLIYDNHGLDVILTLFSSNIHDISIQTLLMWLLRNLTVKTDIRRKVLDKLGFLIVNSLNVHSSNALLAENACWTLGNLVLLDDIGSFFTSMGAMTSVKTAMLAHTENAKVTEAGTWFFYNASFDQTCIKAMMKMQLDEAILGGLKRHQTVPTIVEWVDLIVKRIKANMLANSPAAIAERNANRVIKDGLLKIPVGMFSRLQPRYFILQMARLAYSVTKEDKEIDGEIRLKEINEIKLEKEKNKFRIVTKSKTVILETVDGSSAESWVTEIRQSWKLAVYPVTENPPNPSAPTNHFPFFMPLPETAYLKDIEKIVLHHVYHEISFQPEFSTASFKCQKAYPDQSPGDWLLLNASKRITKEIMENKLKDFLVPDREVYEVDKLKKYITKLVEDDIVNLLEDFERNPRLNEAPQISTRYEYNAKQGIRPTMEDRHVHIPYMDLLIDRKSKNPISYYAVYDGHGGTHVASFVETHLHMNLLKHPELETDTKKAITESFAKTQDELKELTERIGLSTTAGSTAVTCLIIGKQMYVSWAGDSLASIFRKDNTQEDLINPPHKPGIPEEKARIEQLGGFVNDENGVMRVNGVVAVTRAFGNLRHRVILPEPDIRVLDVTDDLEYLVIACDGLWDVMSSADVRAFVNKYMAKNGNRLKGISDALVTEALALGSTDNVSVIFVEFTWWKAPRRG